MATDPSAPSGQQVPLWKVGAVQDLPILASGSSYVRGKDVEIIFWDGSTEHLQFPLAQYNDQAVASAAQASAMTHVKVKGQQGPLIDPGQLQGY